MVRFCSKSKNLKFRLKLLIANAILLVHPSYYWATMDKIKIENGYFQRTYNVHVCGCHVIFESTENGMYPDINFDKSVDVFDYLRGFMGGVRGDIKFQMGTKDGNGGIIWRDIEVA